MNVCHLFFEILKVKKLQLVFTVFIDPIYRENSCFYLVLPCLNLGGCIIYMHMHIHVYICVCVFILCRSKIKKIPL